MAARARLPRDVRGYGPAHQALRAELAPHVAAGGVRCARCGELIAAGEPWDLGHVDEDRSRYAGPEHQRCNRATAGRRPWAPVPVLEEAERAGLPADHSAWGVPWLEGLRGVPGDAVWPRLMTVPHPRATGSLGGEFVGWAEARTGGRLRWWQ